MKNVSPPVI